MAQKVMISSTLLDLPDHRQAVMEACHAARMTPVAMEIGSATSERAVDTSLDYVDQADVYVGIWAHRYGTVPRGLEKSITHLEYERALGTIPVFAFFMSEDHRVPPSDYDTGTTAEKLARLKEEIRERHTVSPFGPPSDLRGRVYQALIEHVVRPWDRADEGLSWDRGQKVDVSRLPPTGSHLSPRDEEISRLTELWEDPDRRVVSITAFGGVGKSSLVQQWLREMETDGYRGAERVFAWSFYRQGWDDAVSRSTVEFFEDALRWFGHRPPFPENPRERANALVRLICLGRTLLVLDGLEPHQLRGGPTPGRISDDGLQVLVRRLVTSMQGLCVIATREPVADVAGHPAATRVELLPLSQQAGAQLLRSLGVKGTDAQLRRASEMVRGHCLSLNLLGRFVVTAWDGDARRVEEIDFSALPLPSPEAEHARRIMGEYESILDESRLAIIRLIGFFDRPAPQSMLRALLDDERLGTLTGPAAQLDEAAWNASVSWLRELGLLAPRDRHEPSTLDTHPIVRDHFRQRLEADFPDEYGTGHERLYRHLSEAAVERPENLEEALPLFDALNHACRAGLHSEAFQVVYVERIARSLRRFLRRRVPASGAHLAALAHFFETPWTRPSRRLDREQQVRLWDEAGHYLFALGHPSAAILPLTKAYEEHRRREKWERASYIARIVRESYLIKGDLYDAGRSAEASVRAGREADAYHRMSSLAGHAQVLHHKGQWADAERAFRSAEEAHREYDYAWYQPHEVPATLVFVWGFWYAEYLLDQAERMRTLATVDAEREWPIERHPVAAGPRPLLDEIRVRTLASLDMARKDLSSFDIAQDNLTIGRLDTIDWVSGGRHGPNPGAERLERGVALLRQINQQHHLVAAILHMADAYRLERRHDESMHLIDEAEEITAVSGMRLFASRCALEAALVHLERGESGLGRARLSRAADEMSAMGCHRWDHRIEQGRREMR